MPDQLIQLQLGGIDTKTHSFLTLPTKLLALQNLIMLQTGSLSKRWGYTALGQNILGTANNINQCKAIQAFNNELILFDSLNAYSYSQAENAWLNRGDVQSVILSEQLVIRNTSQQLSPDMCSIGGIEVYVWEDSRGTIRYSILDASNGIQLLTDQALYTGIPSSNIRPKCIPFTTADLAVVFFINSSGQIMYVPISPNRPWTNATANYVINGASSYFDACAANSSIYLAYYTASSVIVVQFDHTLTIINQTTVASISGVPTGVISVATDISGNVYVSYGDNGPGTLTASTVVLSSTLSILSGPTQTINQSTGALQAIAAVGNSSGSLSIFAEAAGTQTYNNVVYQQTITSAGAIGSTTVFRRSVGLASKPFVYDNHGVYINLAYQDNNQSSYFTVDSSGNVMATINPSLGGGLISSNDWVVPECQQVQTGIFKFANLVRGIVNSEAGQVFALLGVNSSKLDFIDSNNFLSVAINQGLYTVGGILQSYDGSQFVESGYHNYPANITLTPSSTGGHLGSGNATVQQPDLYQYAITYEWIDNNGDNLPSTPSIVYSVSFTSGTTNSVSLNIPTLRLTRKSNVMIVVYRTIAGGSLLYRATSALTPIYNDPTIDSITFVDELSDAAIQSNGLMYTQPLPEGNTVLENDTPPACSLICAFDDRIFLGGLESPDLLWYSQQTIPNAPMQFSSTLTYQLDPDGGPITALVRMDSNLIIFKKNAIFYITGTGPDATGNNNNYSPAPIQIPSSGVGCKNQNTVSVATPLGILFDSGNGIYLLDHNLNVSYKGNPAQAFNGLTITSCSVIPNQWVVFTTSTSTALVYDYFYDQWKTFTNHSAVDSEIYLGNNNLFVFANASGTVFQQTPNVYSDNGVWIPSSLTTSWIDVATATSQGGSGGAPGVQGFQRVKQVFILGNYQGAHTLNLAVAQDYNNSFSQYSSTNVPTALGVSTYGSVSPYGADPFFGGGGLEQFVYQFRYDVFIKGESIQLQISDQQSNPGNQGFTIAAVSLLVQVKRGAMKLPLSKQITNQ